jgi:predicted RNA-binding Zn ribbon-like protein
MQLVEEEGPLEQRPVAHTKSLVAGSGGKKLVEEGSKFWLWGAASTHGSSCLVGIGDGLLSASTLTGVKGYSVFSHYGQYTKVVRSQVDFSHYGDQPVQTAADLVNTFNIVTGEELLATPEDVAAFLLEHGTEEWSNVGWVASETDLHEVRALRARLRQVFWAANAASVATILNVILQEVGAVPRISTHGKSAHLHFEPLDASPARWLGSVTAMGLGVALIEGGYERLGVCDSSTCDDVYVDTSRNRSRRHCSDTCTTRENVAAFRARRRTDSESAR